MKTTNLCIKPTRVQHGNETLQQSEIKLSENLANKPRAKRGDLKKNKLLIWKNGFAILKCKNQPPDKQRRTGKQGGKESLCLLFSFFLVVCMF